MQVRQVVQCKIDDHLNDHMVHLYDLKMIVMHLYDLSMPVRAAWWQCSSAGLVLGGQ